MNRNSECKGKKESGRSQKLSANAPIYSVNPLFV